MSNWNLKLMALAALLLTAVIPTSQASEGKPARQSPIQIEVDGCVEHGLSASQQGAQLLELVPAICQHILDPDHARNCRESALPLSTAMVRGELRCVTPFSYSRPGHHLQPELIEKYNFALFIQTIIRIIENGSGEPVIKRFRALAALNNTSTIKEIFGISEEAATLAQRLTRQAALIVISTLGGDSIWDTTFGKAAREMFNIFAEWAEAVKRYRERTEFARWFIEPSPDSINTILSSACNVLSANLNLDAGATQDSKQDFIESILSWKDRLFNRTALLLDQQEISITDPQNVKEIEKTIVVFPHLFMRGALTQAMYDIATMLGVGYRPAAGEAEQNLKYALTAHCMRIASQQVDWIEEVKSPLENVVLRLLELHRVATGENSIRVIHQHRTFVIRRVSNLSNLLAFLLLSGTAVGAVSLGDYPALRNVTFGALASLTAALIFKKSGIESLLWGALCTGTLAAITRCHQTYRKTACQ